MTMLRNYVILSDMQKNLSSFEPQAAPRRPRNTSYTSFYLLARGCAASGTDLRRVGRGNQQFILFYPCYSLALKCAASGSGRANIPARGFASTSGSRNAKASMLLTWLNALQVRNRIRKIRGADSTSPR